MAQRVVAGPITLAEHGQTIFVYGHVRTNQIVYSLSRTLNNNAALKQLPYLGKQTVPATIRKDLWRPLCRVSFPSGAQGLSAYQRLREFRKRHEHEWNHAAVRTRSRVKVGRDLRDQKANSIADMAAVLLGQEQVAMEQDRREDVMRVIKEDRRAKAQGRLDRALVARREALRKEGGDKEAFRAAKNEKMRIQRALRQAEAGDEERLIAVVAAENVMSEQRTMPKTIEGGTNAEPEKAGQERKLRGPRLSMDGVRIEWTNVLDAEFARTWPAAVVHEELQRGGNRTRNVPPSVLRAVLPTRELVAPQKSAPRVDVSAVSTGLTEAALQQQPSRLQMLVDRLKFGAR